MAPLLRNNSMGSDIREPARGGIRRDLRAIWLVRSKVLEGDLRFWLVVIGYDPHSRSINNRIYLVYALAFIALWIFMMLTLAADFAARFLQALPFGSAQSAAVGAGTLGLLGLFLYELYRATQRSPFVFSEADAHYLCTAPLDRRPVAILWLITTWIEHGLAVWAISVVLGYALLQAGSPHALTAADLPAFLGAGVRMVSLIIPLYLGLLALAWSAGAWRLRGAREKLNLRWSAPALAVLLGGLILVFGADQVMTVLMPLAFFVQAGLGLAPWSLGMGLALLSAVVGLAVLWQASSKMSLARAAQETHDREALKAARMSGRLDLANELAQKDRLRAGRKPTRLPGGVSAAALVWKNTLQSVRRFQLGDLLAWLGIAAASLAMLAYSGWGTRGWAVVIWSLLVIQQAISPLRKELSRWWLFRQLPVPSDRRTGAVLVLPVVGIWLAGLLALAAAWVLHLSVSGLGVWLYLVVAPSVALAAAMDILRQSKTQDLLAGRVPDQTLVTVLLALLIVVLEAGFAWLLLVKWAYPMDLALPLLMAENVGILVALWRTVGSQLRDIR